MTELSKTFEQGFFLKDIAVDEKHQKSLDTIRQNLPETTRATKLFARTQSEFMNTMMTVSHHTPIRNLRQILAEIEKSMMALKEAYFSRKKENIKLEIKRNELSDEKDSLKAQLIQVEIDEMLSQREDSEKYINAAIKRVANYQKQYNAIQAKFKLQDFTEEQFEDEEERYHIMKAFSQALNAFRSRGVVDEGNQIYFSQIGINGTVANAHIKSFIQQEHDLMKEDKEPTHEMQVAFLNYMAILFSGCSRTLAASKGQLTGAEYEV